MNVEEVDASALRHDQLKISVEGHAPRLEAGERSFDQDSLARVLVIYTGGTIGMVMKDGGL